MSESKKPDDSNKSNQPEKPENSNKDNQSNKPSKDSQAEIKKNLNEKEDNSNKDNQSDSKDESNESKDSNSSLLKTMAKKSKAGQLIARAKATAKKIKATVKKVVKAIKKTVLTVVKVVTSPFFWVGVAVVGIMIIANGISVTVGQNTYETTCGAFSAPQFTPGSVTVEKERGKLIMGHFINDGMTTEQASQLSAYIMQSSKGDSKHNLKDSNCNNKCIIASKESGIGLIPFTNSDLKKLGEFARKGNSDWRDSSTQLRFISDKIKESKNVDKFKEDPSIDNIDEMLGVSYSGNKTNLETYAKELNKTYKDEGAECQAIGIGKRRNYWSPTSTGPDSTGAANVDMSSVVDFAWSYASDKKIKTHGSFKSPNSYPPAVTAMEMAHKVKPDSGDILASCDRGVAIAMIATKTDVKYPYGAVENQYQYIKSDPKYQKVSCGERKPGDIMIWWYKGQGKCVRGRNRNEDVNCAGHTTLYVGKMPGKQGEWMVESSYQEYEPMKSQWNFGTGSSCGVHRKSSNIVEYWRCTGCKEN